MISRRFFLAGALAVPAIVAAGSLMPLRGVKFDPIVRVQSWPIGEGAFGAYWSHEGPLSKVGAVEDAMREMFGAAYSKVLDIQPDMTEPSFASLGGMSNLGVKPTYDERAEHHRMATGVLYGEHNYRRPLPRRFSYRGGVVQPDSDYPLELQKLSIDRYKAYHTRTTRALRRQLAEICHWGA
jgi:hypothetical protein